jgi:hypothetical protein
MPAPGRGHARPEEPAESGGGRRRRAEGAPSWQEARQADEPVNGAGPDPSERSGSHASGHSVADLLAAHGDTKPRRRRRRED